MVEQDSHDWNPENHRPRLPSLEQIGHFTRRVRPRLASQRFPIPHMPTVPPRAPIKKSWLSVFSLEPHRLGQVLRSNLLQGTTAGGVTCVKFSPSATYAILGYGVRDRPNPRFNDLPIIV